MSCVLDNRISTYVAFGPKSIDCKMFFCTGQSIRRWLRNMLGDALPDTSNGITDGKSDFAAPDG